MVTAAVEQLEEHVVAVNGRVHGEAALELRIVVADEAPGEIAHDKGFSRPRKKRLNQSLSNNACLSLAEQSRLTSASSRETLFTTDALFVRPFNRTEWSN